MRDELVESLRENPEMVAQLIGYGDDERCSGETEFCGKRPDVAFVSSIGNSVTIGVACTEHAAHSQAFHPGIEPTNISEYCK